MTTTNGTIGRGARASIQNTGISGQDRQAARGKPRSLREDPAERPVLIARMRGDCSSESRGEGPAKGGFGLAKLVGWGLRNSS